MQARDAVAIAKRYVMETFLDEAMSRLALEEIEFDDAGEAWLITLGFLRPADRTKPALDRLLPVLSDSPTLERVYRVVKVRDGDGTVASVKIRDLAA